MRNITAWCGDWVKAIDIKKPLAEIGQGLFLFCVAGTLLARCLLFNQFGALDRVNDVPGWYCGVHDSGFRFEFEHALLFDDDVIVVTDGE